MRRLTMLSGSKLELAALCAWGFQPDVPQTDIGPVDARARGTAFHALVQLVVDGAFVGEAEVSEATRGMSEADASIVSGLFESWTGFYLGQLMPGARAEVTYAFDVKTREVRELGQNLNREYEKAGLRPTEIPVTVDLVFQGERGPFVYDWKTGRQMNRKPIGEHTQLRAGGYCAAKVAGKDEAAIIVSYVDEDGVREEGGELSDFDFVAIEESLIALHAAVTSSPQPRPGPHCEGMWCGAIASCPSAQQAVKDLEEGERSPATALVVSNAAAIRSKEQAALMFTKLKQIDALSEACWRALKAYVDVHGEVPLSDGKVYAAVEESRDSIRVNLEALAVLRRFLDSHADAAVKSTITKDAIAEATKAKVGGGGKARAQLERDVLLALEEVGAIHVSTFTTHKVAKPKKADAV